MDENIYGLMKFYIFYVWKNLTRTTAARIEGKKEKKKLSFYRSLFHENETYKIVHDFSISWKVSSRA